MSTKLLAAQLQVVVTALCASMRKAGDAESAEMLLQNLADAAKFSDGRKTSWSPERRAAFGAKVSEAWAAKRGDAPTDFSKAIYYAFRYRDAEGEKVGSYAELAAHSGLAVKSIQNKLSANRAGFVVRGAKPVVYALSRDDCINLCSAEAEEAGNQDLVITLPSKKSVGRRF